MPDYQAMIKQAKAELERETESLAAWESFDSATVIDEKGKELDARSQMIARCKWNMQKSRETIAALEKRAQGSN